MNDALDRAAQAAYEGVWKDERPWSEQTESCRQECRQDVLPALQVMANEIRALPVAHHQASWGAIVDPFRVHHCVSASDLHRILDEFTRGNDG